MRHIKLYEDYSDEDLTDLISDLDEIGHMGPMIEGRDFGFDQDLKGVNDGKSILFISKTGLEKIRKSKLTYPKDKDELMWPTWDEYQMAYLPVPRIYSGKYILSASYPQIYSVFVGSSSGMGIDGLDFIQLGDTATGRDFPANKAKISLSTFKFDLENPKFRSAINSRIISKKRVKEAYDVIVKKFKEIKYRK
jgi:hypothetical protein